MSLHLQNRFVFARLAAVMCIAAILLPGCNGAATSQPAAPTIDVKLKDKHFSLEIAATEKERESGLMYRKTMPADHGMIFLFATAHSLSFWMKNTLLLLDLIYLDAHGKVIDILPLAPNDETPVTSSRDALYAIELNRGAAADADLHVGDVIELPKKLPTAEADPQ